MLYFPKQTSSSLVRVTPVETKQPRLGSIVWSALLCQGASPPDRPYEPPLNYEQ